MLDRKEILEKALHDCLVEMYAKAQPSADWNEIVKEYEAGKRDKEDRVYEQHYLSQDEFTYIADKYQAAYGINSHWNSDVEVVEKYLYEGGLKDKYIEDHTDEDGNHHPGYRSAEKVKPIESQIAEYLDSHNGYGMHNDDMAKDITKLVMKTVNDCKNFYRFDREASDFRCAVALGCSPTSSMERVKEYWKEKIGEDLEIEERNPKLFWYRDNGYTDEDLEEEFDSPDWKAIVDKEWKDEVAKKERESQKKMEALRKKLEEMKK